ncbi:MAG: glycosyltransferase family 2 protein [Candidatus Aminicenantes bacterium]|nr:glycosyltransferase family 2 protein [Candidatus Aminicenantes bacterium]
MSVVGAVEISVVLPCLNEEAAIGNCLKKIKDVFARENLAGEIIVADNGSTDRSREIAHSEGARVVTEPDKGYGAACRRGLRETSGTYIVLADADASYDFGEIPKFLKPLREGFDLVLGSRLKGTIEKGAMSWPNRRLGNPILSGIFRLFFRTKLSDIHCGMRAMTRDAYRKMRLRSSGMEFASEMVVAALALKLEIAEVPIRYAKRLGRSKLTPLSDAWRHLKFMLLFCPLWLYLIPGLAGFMVSLAVLLLSLGGPFRFLGRTWDIHLTVFAGAILIVSFEMINLGVFAHLFAVTHGLQKRGRWTVFFERRFKIEKGLILGAVIFLAGLAVNLFIFLEWFSSRFGALHRIRESILAMILLVLGLQIIFSSFFISHLLWNEK